MARSLRVLITGAAGATACYLAEHIRTEYPETEVIGMTRTWTNSFPVVDVVFHLAGRTRIADSFRNPIPFWQDNAIGTVNLLEAVRLCSPKARVLVTSTCEVYGAPLTSPMAESHPMNPLSPYAVSKAAADMAARMYAKAHGLHVVVSRLFNLINPRAEHLFSTSFARQVAEIETGQREFLTHGNLDSSRTLLDVRDVCAAYWMLLEKGTPGEAYNIGTTKETGLGEFIITLALKAKCNIALRLDPTLVRPIDLPTQIADSRKFIAATGWKPRYSLDESIDFLLAHWRQRV